MENEKYIERNRMYECEDQNEDEDDALSFLLF